VVVELLLLIQHLVVQVIHGTGSGFNIFNYYISRRRRWRFRKCF
jgi:hypothetical protein